MLLNDADKLAGTAIGSLNTTVTKPLLDIVLIFALNKAGNFLSISSL